jgi:hypothetical protein
MGSDTGNNRHDDTTESDCDKAVRIYSLPFVDMGSDTDNERQDDATESDKEVRIYQRSLSQIWTQTTINRTVVSPSLTRI